ncbi:362_t:CDS:2 [Paraglomus occultum]|uniref:362_t:CDS:1 n=1 Tax=Paraglomus occultum TaxID=144539 RepID=A0A9N9AML6_9GLOM|nr:362_t:CDS:2 [Paraglomus occultum]
MSKRKLSQKYIADSDVDEEEQQLADDPEESSLKKKKSSKSTGSKTKKRAIDNEDDDQDETADGQAFFKLSERKRASVRKWKDIAMVDIREFYDGKPTRKGISLTMDQWKKLKSFIDDIDNELKKL